MECFLYVLWVYLISLAMAMVSPCLEGGMCDVY